MARILVIDDEHNIRMMVQLALEQVGHEVDTAADGPSGLEKFGDSSGYDLVLLDQRMPGMEGLEVLQEMKSRNPNARIVMITAFGTIDLAVDAMKAGATDFLRKPFTTETLRGAVIGALMTTPRTELQPAPSMETPTEPIESSPILYGLTTVNGYHIESNPEAVKIDKGDIRYTFFILSPSGEKESCIVLLSTDVLSEVETIIHRKYSEIDRFWHALCEQVLANYLYQNAEIPADHYLRVDEVDRSLRNWVKAVVSAV